MPKLTESSRNLRCQDALVLLLDGAAEDVVMIQLQEVFRFMWHPASVGLILPQDRAMVSKTRSYLNEGF